MNISENYTILLPNVVAGIAGIAGILVSYKRYSPLLRIANLITVKRRFQVPAALQLFSNDR